MNKLLKICLVAAIGFTCLAAEAVQWQCNVRNPVRNQFWVGVGPTPALAKLNAMRICANHSVNAGNCVPMRCFPR